jgi:hypothetical protein
VDYSLFMMVSVDDVVEVGEATGATPTMFLSNLCWNSLCFVVSCFSAASPRERLGGGVFI